MIDYNLLKDRSLALLIWNTEKENDAHVFLGKLIQKGADYLFVNEAKNWVVSLDQEKLERLTEVPPDLKEVFLDADYCITLYMAGLPDESNSDFNATGMKWHEE